MHQEGVDMLIWNHTFRLNSSNIFLTTENKYVTSATNVLYVTAVPTASTLYLLSDSSPSSVCLSNYSNHIQLPITS